MTSFRVGELARRTGVSVRTLHHYDEIGLLSPSGRGAGDHRLYTGRDLARLERILALKALGLALEEIRTCLAGEGPGLSEVLERKLAELRTRIAEEQQLALRLASLRERLATREEATVEQVLETLETMKMYEKYYTPEQMQQLQRRATELGPERMAEVQAEWPRLIAAVRAAMERGADPSDPEVRALAARWDELVRLFTGGDPGITASLGNLYKGEPGLRQQQGLDPELMAYLGRARAGGSR